MSRPFEFRTYVLHSSVNSALCLKCPLALFLENHSQSRSKGSHLMLEDSMRKLT